MLSRFFYSICLTLNEIIDLRWTSNSGEAGLGIVAPWEGSGEAMTFIFIASQLYNLRCHFGSLRHFETGKSNIFIYIHIIVPDSHTKQMEVKSHQPRINMNQPPGLWPVLLGAEGGGGAACSCFKRLAFRGCAIGHWGLSKDIAWI
jgi:hypothetical protein